MLGRGRKWMHMLLADTALPPQGYSIKQCNGFYNTTGNNQDFPWITGQTKGDKRSLANPKQRQKISPSCCRKGMKSSATVPARAWLDDPETTWWLRLPIPEGKTCLINAQTTSSHCNISKQSHFCLCTNISLTATSGCQIHHQPTLVFSPVFIFTQDTVTFLATNILTYELMRDSQEFACSIQYSLWH